MLNRQDIEDHAATSSNLVIVQADPEWFRPENLGIFSAFELDLQYFAQSIALPVYRFIPYAPALIHPEPDAAFFESILKKISITNLPSSAVHTAFTTCSNSLFELEDNRDYVFASAQNMKLLHAMNAAASPADSTGFSLMSPHKFDPYLKVSFDG